MSMKDSMLYNACEAYAKKYLTPKAYYEKSTEFYFGENNPLKTRLIENITYIRELARDAYSSKPNAKPKDILPALKPGTEKLRQTIIEEFNLEGCYIGWENATNAACFTQLGNEDIYGKDEKNQKLRIALDDIVTTDSTGFHYKKSKGIYYCIVLGYNIFALDTLFSIEEAAAVLVHELGHGMQHIVSTLNMSISIGYFEFLFQLYTTYGDLLSSKDLKYIQSLMKRIREAYKRGDNAEVSRIGKEVLDAFKDKGNGYKNWSDEKIKQTMDEENPDWDKDTSKRDERKINGKEKWSIFKTIGGIFRSVFGLVGSIFIIPSMFFFRKKVDDVNNDEHIYKVFEQTADNFCQIYGLGVYQATALKKLDRASSSSPTLIEKVPFLDIIRSFNELYKDRYACYFGYPTNKQRAINLYKSAMFELQHNKDLSEDSKKELKKQIEQYKAIYDEFVAGDKKKGFFYKLICGINRETLESAAKKDKHVDEQVLIPLQEKMDPNFDPETAYDPDAVDKL